MERSSDESKESHQSKVPPPPDGGWGWVVCFASFMTYTILSGVVYSFGVLLQPLVLAFDSDPATVSWVSSLLTGVCMMSGPIVAGLVHKYGCRPVCMAGGIISCTGLALSSFAPSIPVLMLTFGLIGGIGLGMVDLTSTVSVGYYFESKRALAMGISGCGSGVGTLAFAPLATILLEHVEWRGVFLSFAGCCLGISLFGALMRPLELVERNHHQRESLEEEINHSGQKNGAAGLHKKPSSENYMGPTDVEKGGDKAELPVQPDHIPATTLHLRPQICSRDRPILRALYRNDTLYTGTIRHKLTWDEYRKSVLSIPRSLHPLSHVKRVFHHHHHLSFPKAHPEKTALKNAPGLILTILKDMFHIDLLGNHLFLLNGFVNVFATLGIFTPFVFLPDMARSSISQEDANILISVMGVANMVGRVFVGLISDLKCVNPLMVTNLTLFINGISIIILPLCDGRMTYIATSFVFGASMAAQNCLISIILVRLFGLENLTNAFGLMLLFRGMASMVGTPLAGMVYGVTGSYQAAFSMSGGFVILAGVLSCCVYLLQRKRDKVAELE